jgi:hypothetical protein
MIRNDSGFNIKQPYVCHSSPPEQVIGAPHNILAFYLSGCLLEVRDTASSFLEMTGRGMPLNLTSLSRCEDAEKESPN